MTPIPTNPRGNTRTMTPSPRPPLASLNIFTPTSSSAKPPAVPPSLAVAAQRPNLPIISVTPDERVANQLALVYANSAFVRPYSINAGIQLARELKASGYLQLTTGRDDLTAVIVSGNRDLIGTDTIKVRQI